MAENASIGSGSRSVSIVVVGGGVAGAGLAKSLQSVGDVVLIDPKEYLEIPWACLRSMVEPSFSKRSLIEHQDYLTNGRLITSSAIGVTEKEVLLSNGVSVPFDYLVVASGRAVGHPHNRNDRIAQFEREKKKIVASSSVLIIGGGPTGVELAGEICTDFPEKKVILVHKGPRLLEFIGHKASQKALDWLVSKKVDVLLNQSINIDSISEAEHVYTTSTEEKITADCHFVCVSTPLGSSWLRDSFLNNLVDNYGRLMVDENMRVRGHKNIFAIGDITDLDEIKQGFLAQRHAEVAAKNLNILINGAPETKLGKYKASSAMAVVSLGRKEGVAQLPFVTLSGCLPGRIKSRDLFIGKSRKKLGLADAVDY